ncbi:hypothetical protein [Actinoplanes sp. NPDC051411]|uniref:hypothetical protein n=1 Tax=Actinoplanes sp. NPDC051411 TaxID=3155522 RepID=UPI00344925CF
MGVMGSPGDLQPLPGLGLRQAGHAVRFAAHGEFETLVIGPGLAMVGPTAADRAGAKLVGAHLQPATPTREFAAAAAPLSRDLLGPLNRLTWAMSQRLFWRAGQSSPNGGERAGIDIPRRGAAGAHSVRVQPPRRPDSLRLAAGCARHRLLDAGVAGRGQSAAHRLHRGRRPSVDPREKFTARALAKALGEAGRRQSAARRLGSDLFTEDGVRTAVAVLEQLP